MKPQSHLSEGYGGASVAPLDQESTRAALDELFTLAGRYNSSDAYVELMRFVGRFRFYSPFNAILIHTQMPGAHFVCTARKSAEGLSSGDQNQCPADCDPATDGTHIVCVRC
jgi:hypothetical protein